MHVLLTTRLLKESCSTLQGTPRASEEASRACPMDWNRFFFMSRFTINLWPSFFNFFKYKKKKDFFFFNGCECRYFMSGSVCP